MKFVSNTAYDQIADWYDAWVSSLGLDDDPVFACVERFTGGVDGLRICEIGTGQGRVARRLVDPAEADEHRTGDDAGHDDRPPCHRRVDVLRLPEARVVDRA